MIADDELVENRLNICKTCDKFKTLSASEFLKINLPESLKVDFCDVCKCPIQTKIRVFHTKCPENKW